MSDTVVISLCQELDQAWAEFLELIEAYQQQRKRTNFLINNGHLELAQAKYVMGPNKISRYQYDRRMQASTMVDWNSDHFIDVERSEGSSNDTSLNLPGPGRWVISTKEAHSSTSREPQINAIGDPDQIRQRGPRSLEHNQISKDIEDDKKKTSGFEMTEEAVLLTTFESATEAAARQTRRDPVNWFGILSPAHLKNAQNSFQQAVFELTTSANLTHRISIAQSRIQALQDKKNALISDQ